MRPVLADALFLVSRTLRITEIAYRAGATTNIEVVQAQQTARNAEIEMRGLVAELAELLRGERGMRTHAGQVSLFKSVGTALEDLAAASLVLSRSC